MDVQAVSEQREHKKPERTCAGCGRAEGADAMVRLVRGPEGELAVDMAGGAFGRGAHVHPRKDCVAKACKGGLSRTFKANVKADADTLAREIAFACDRRMEGLLASALRKRALAVGADAACEALESGAPLAVVAVDAGTVVSRGPIARAIAEGRAVAWCTKAVLGGLLDRDEVAVLALLDRSIAAAFSAARATAGAVSPDGGAA
jgi:predicted RNA-binding protein YlxR (DUF448 family)